MTPTRKKFLKQYSYLDESLQTISPAMYLQKQPAQNKLEAKPQM